METSNLYDITTSVSIETQSRGNHNLVPMTNFQLKQEM